MRSILSSSFFSLSRLTIPLALPSGYLSSDIVQGERGGGQKEICDLTFSKWIRLWRNQRPSVLLSRPRIYWASMSLIMITDIWLELRRCLFIFFAERLWNSLIHPWQVFDNCQIARSDLKSQALVISLTTSSKNWSVEWTRVARVPTEKPNYTSHLNLISTAKKRNCVTRFYRRKLFNCASSSTSLLWRHQGHRSVQFRIHFFHVSRWYLKSN